MGRKKKQRKVADYTNIGTKIASLGTQVEVGTALSLSQQTVSKKLRGEVGIFLADIEELALQFNKTVTWFFQGYDGWPSNKPGDVPRMKADK